MVARSSKLDQYEKLNKLGEGTYGVVYKAIESEYESIPLTAIREISLLEELQHPNVFSNPLERKLVIVFEYVQEDLKNFLTSRRKAGLEPQIVKLLKGIEVCHKNKILNRDLKPQNLLISKQGIFKIADFGLVSYSFWNSIKKLYNEVVTLWYRPPDQSYVPLGSKHYSTSIDIWSKLDAYSGNSYNDELKRIFKVTATSKLQDFPGLIDLPNRKEDQFEVYPKENLSKLCPGLDELGIQLLDKRFLNNPLERITAKKALNHPYFAYIIQSLKQLYK